jgi:hypothetical protein
LDTIRYDLVVGVRKPSAAMNMNSLTPLLAQAKAHTENKIKAMDING